MTRPGTEPRCPGPLAKAKDNYSNLDGVIFVFIVLELLLCLHRVWHTEDCFGFVRTSPIPSKIHLTGKKRMKFNISVSNI